MTRIKYFLITIFLSCFFVACEKDSDLTCGFIDPINELGWLTEHKATVNESCNAVTVSLFQGTYKRKTVFFIQPTDPQVSTVFSASLYDCDGDMIKEFGGSEMDEFNDKVSDRHVIYSCEDRPTD